MENFVEEKVIYPFIEGVNYDKYGFLKVNDGVIFSIYKLGIKEDIHKTLAFHNFRDLADCYYFAMKLDAELSRFRKRKLSTFLKSIWDQKDINVCHVMISAVNFLSKEKYSEINEFTENNIITEIVKAILPNAGFFRKIVDGLYVWELDSKKKFSMGIGKAFYLYYINNRFDKDATWKDIKKNCCLKNGVWCYKNIVAKQKMESFLKSYVKSGGVIMESVNMEFEVRVAAKDVDGKEGMVGKDRFVKKSADGKNYFIMGVASTTDLDWDEERVSENFIKSMKKQAVGLPLKVISHYGTGDLNQTVGVVTDKGGDKDTFMIEGKLQPPEDNENVSKLFKQMDFGINYGFSIYGRVTKIIRETDKKLKKEILVLDDGELSHILITDQPCNRHTFAEAIIKSLKDKGDFHRDRLVANKVTSKYKHATNIHKAEPSWDKIEKSGLPDQAYPVNYTSGNVYKDYPHHYVGDNDTLFLHKGQLIDSYRKAVDEGADDFIINHLETHIKVAGLSNSLTAIKSIVEKIEKVEGIKIKFDNEILPALDDLKKSINAVKNLDNTTENKMKILKSVIEKVAQHIYDVLSDIESEEE